MKTMKLSPEDRRRFWLGHIDDWRASGLSRTAYCKQNDINLSQLIYWLRKNDPAESESTPAAFLRVNAIQGGGEERVEASASHFRLEFHDTLFLHWHGEANPQYIRHLIKALSE